MRARPLGLGDRWRIRTRFDNEDPGSAVCASSAKSSRRDAFPIEDEPRQSKFTAMAHGSSILTVPAALADAPLSRHDDIVAVLLIAMVTAIVVCVGVLRLIIRRELRRRAGPRPLFDAASFSAAVFEAPSRWLAVRSQNPQAIQAALVVQHPRACSWSDALATPFEPRLFISPPVNGWIVIMGCDLPDPADDVDECYKFLADLSRKLGEVQLFSRNRAVSHHGWARLSDGKVMRAYAWAGETLWNQGALTDAERELKMRCLTYTESSDVLGLAERELLALNTDRVVRLAASWSIDPTAVQGADLESKGIAGDLLHWKLH
jgi:hypothetical protein